MGKKGAEGKGPWEVEFEELEREDRAKSKPGRQIESGAQAQREITLQLEEVARAYQKSGGAVQNAELLLRGHGVYGDQLHGILKRNEQYKGFADFAETYMNKGVGKQQERLARKAQEERHAREAREKARGIHGFFEKIGQRASTELGRIRNMARALDAFIFKPEYRFFAAADRKAAVQALGEEHGKRAQRKQEMGSEGGDLLRHVELERQYRTLNERDREQVLDTVAARLNFAVSLNELRHELETKGHDPMSGYEASPEDFVDEEGRVNKELHAVMQKNEQVLKDQWRKLLSSDAAERRLMQLQMRDSIYNSFEAGNISKLEGAAAVRPLSQKGKDKKWNGDYYYVTTSFE